MTILLNFLLCFYLLFYVALMPVVCFFALFYGSHRIFFSINSGIKTEEFEVIVKESESIFTVYATMGIMLICFINYLIRLGK